MLKTARRSTLHEDVLKQLYEAIEKGLWEPGSRLPGEQALAVQFRVSRNCIREAMKVLADRGMVFPRPGSGTFLSGDIGGLLHSPRMKPYFFYGINLKEIVETRCLIEGQIAYYAAERGTDEEIGELESLLCDAEDPDVQFEIHIQFHGKLAQIARHKLLERMLSSVQHEINVQRERYREYHGETLKDLLYNHSGIVRQIRGRNPEGARKAMIDHIKTVWVGMFHVPLDV